MVGLDRSGYLGGFEGRESILGSPDNGRIHYQEGSWVFYSLNYVLGDTKFDRAMRAFIRARQPGVPAGYQQFIAAMSHAAGRDMTGFIMPWLSGKYIPNVDAHINGQRVIVTQSQPDMLFDLPLELALTTASGTVRRSIHLTHRVGTLNVRDLGALTAVNVDPDHHFLLQRHYGEVVRFELPASAVPDAKIVELAGDFAPKPIPAMHVGDKWVVELPMSEGRYLYAWRIDGVMRGPSGALASHTSPYAFPYGVRVVQPLEWMTGAYPK